MYCILNLFDAKPSSHPFNGKLSAPAPRRSPFRPGSSSARNPHRPSQAEVARLECFLDRKHIQEAVYKPPELGQVLCVNRFTPSCSVSFSSPKRSPSVAVSPGRSSRTSAGPPAWPGRDRGRRSGKSQAQERKESSFTGVGHTKTHQNKQAKRSKQPGLTGSLDWWGIIRQVGPHGRVCEPGKTSYIVPLSPKEFVDLEDMKPYGSLLIHRSTLQRLHKGGAVPAGFEPSTVTSITQKHPKANQR